MTTLRNPTAETKFFACTAQSGVAAGTGDNTELESGEMDFRPPGLTGYDAAQFVLSYKTTLTAAATLKITLKISESDDGSTYDAYETLVSAVTIATGALTGSNGSYTYDLGIHGRKRWAKIKVTLDLSAGASDTFVYGSAVVASSPDRLPAV